MANQQQLALLKQGSTASWNEWRQEHPASRIDLNEADLSGANLSGYDLSGANR